MVSPSIPFSDDFRCKRMKQKQEEDDYDEEEYEQPGAAAEEEELLDPVLILVSGSELVSDDAQQISNFPKAVKRSLTGCHPSVPSKRYRTNCTGLMIENVSHGQLQALSSVSRDNSSLTLDSEAGVYVCSPPPLMEGRGVEKLFDEKIHFVPMHSDWFSPSTVHRLERQVIPHFFSGKSPDHSPEKYMSLRNKIISKYLENPGKRLTFAACQGLVAKNELHDLSRIVRFLDNWGIINYLASSHNMSRLSLSMMSGSLIKENMNGDFSVETGDLRSIDSLILFDKPKCSIISLEDIGLLSSSNPSNANREANGNPDGNSPDLDRKLRERLSEHSCSYCLHPLLDLHYQSQKEADIILCSDCYQDGKFIVGHSSIDFTRTDSIKDTFEPDGDSWTDQETLLLLEGLENYKDNWNEVAKHVGTKSNAQCILHFLRLPLDNESLANMEAMQIDTNGVGHALSYSNADGGDASEVNASYEVPFANTPNPIMSLVAFLAIGIAPRVAAACACASLTVLTKGDSRSSSNISHQKAREEHMITPEALKRAAKTGLSAAATKSKLFAEEEEREIQRLSAGLVTQQMKRMELKLKQFAEVETYLVKQSEQMEKTRQRASNEKMALLTKRSTVMSNMEQMRYLQQQMFGYSGPRLPLSAINPPSPPQSQHIFFNNTSVPHQSRLRPPSGNNAGLG